MKKVDPTAILLADLYNRRNGAGLTQEEVAEYCGISRQCLQIIEMSALKAAGRRLKPVLGYQGINHAARNSPTDIRI